MSSRDRRSFFSALFWLGLASIALLPLPFAFPEAGLVHWVVAGCVILVGIAIFAASIRNFSRAATPVQGTKPTTALVTTGIHGWSRNPIYVGMFLIYCGIGIAVPSPWILVLMLPLAVTSATASSHARKRIWNGALATPTAITKPVCAAGCRSTAAVGASVDPTSSETKVRSSLIAIGFLALALASCATIPTPQEANDSVLMLRKYGDWAWALGIVLIWADMVLPVPQTAVIAALGIIYGTLVGGLLGSLGLVTGGLLGYALMLTSARRFAQRFTGPRSLQKMERLFDRGGAWAIILTRSLPYSVPEAMVFLAGLARMPHGKIRRGA